MKNEIQILNPKAVVLKADLATGEVGDAEFASIARANAAHQVLIGMEKGVRIEQDYNQYGGKHTTALIPQDAARTVWHKTTFETFPKDVVDGE